MGIKFLNQSRTNRSKKIFSYKVFAGCKNVCIYAPGNWGSNQKPDLAVVLQIVWYNPAFYRALLYRAIRHGMMGNNQFQYYFFGSLKGFRCNWGIS